MLLCSQCNVADSCAKYQKGDPIAGDFCIRQFKMNGLFDLGLISEKQRRLLPLRYDIDGTDRDQFMQLHQLSKDIEVFVERGKNLYLYSRGCGNGKTSWALRMCQEYVRKIWFKSDMRPRVLFINVPKFFLMLKDNISHQNDYIAHIKEYGVDADLVVWDDIGTKMGTEFEVENLLNIVNNRIDNGKANIYTSNILPEQLKARVGERLYSRIVNLSDNIELRGADKRGI